jgi:hypothetical protein
VRNEQIQEPRETLTLVGNVRNTFDRPKNVELSFDAGIFSIRDNEFWGGITFSGDRFRHLYLARRDVKTNNFCAKSFGEKPGGPSESTADIQYAAASGNLGMGCQLFDQLLLCRLLCLCAIPPIAVMDMETPNRTV